jgi:hypothetical protein
MRYKVDWYDDYGTKTGVIQAFTSLEYVRTENAIGRMVLTIPRGLYNYEDFKVGQLFEIWRDKNGSLELQNETAYFLQDWQFYANEKGEEYIQLYATDANWLLDTAIVYATAGSADAEMTGIPDDLMKAIVDKQLGASADADRQKLTVDGNVSAGGASVSKAFAYRNVLNVVQELADLAKEGGVYLAFDVVRTAPATFQFRTYAGQRGTDHSRTSGDPRLVGKKYGNLSDATFGTYHSDERNWVLVAGQGEEDARELVVRQNLQRIGASKWNRREYFKDSRDDATTALLEADGDAALNEFRPRQVLTGRLHDTYGMMYGVHYQFGDILTAEAFGYNVDCHVSSVSVKVDQNGGEQIDVRLRGEL